MSDETRDASPKPWDTPSSLHGEKVRELDLRLRAAEDGLQMEREAISQLQEATKNQTHETRRLVDEVTKLADISTKLAAATAYRNGTREKCEERFGQIQRFQTNVVIALGMLVTSTIVIGVLSVILKGILK